jgi:outer membrane protein insertion porin family
MRLLGTEFRRQVTAPSSASLLRGHRHAIVTSTLVAGLTLTIVGVNAVTVRADAPPVVCGLEVPPPASLPPADSPPVIYALVPCFERQGGGSTVEPATYLYYIHTRPSQPSQHLWVPFDEAARKLLVDDFRSLWATGFLDDLSIETVDYVLDNGVVAKVVKFDMEERQRIRIVDYEGSHQLTRSKIEDKLRDEKLSIKSDAFMDAGQIREVEGAIRRMLAEAGYMDSTVGHRLTPIGSGPKLVQLTFSIADGPRYRIRNIEFDGNAAISDRALAHKMKDTKEQWLFSFLTGRGTYKEASYPDDAERLVEHYRNNGFLRVRVDNPQLRVLRDSADGKTREIELHIPISEGPRYRVGEFRIADNKVVKSEALATIFKVRKGEVYSEQSVRKGLEKARELYGMVGHFEFTGYPDYKFSDEKEQPTAVAGSAAASAAAVAEAHAGTSPTVDVTVHMQEGEQYFVNRIAFVGNLTTKDNVIRREMQIVEGGVFNTEALKYSVRRIDQLGYFKPLQQREEGGEDPVHIEKVASAKNKVDVTLKLQEQNRNELSFGAGLSGIDGTFVNGSFATSNFLGQGETVQLSALLGVRATQYSVGITEPYLFDRPISGGGTLYSRKVNYYSQGVLWYSEVRNGASLTGGVPLARFLRGFASYTYEVIDTAWNDDFTSSNTTTSTGVTFNPFLEEGRHIESRAGLSAVYNTVDNPFMPHRGMRLSANADVAGGALGGTVSYLQPEAEAVLFIPVMRRTAFGLRAQGGFIRPYGVTEALPYYRRYFLGGENQIRGVDIRTVGPPDAENRALGGTKFVLFNAEYCIDLVGSFRAVLFHDAGQAFAETDPINLYQLRTSSGAELRFLMPVMNVPFRLIYAWNIYRDSFQPARALKFAVGTTF